MANTSRTSKLLSLMLRHRPDEFGLEIDAYGYAPLDQVVQGVQERYAEVAEADIVNLVNAPGQYRFELNEFGIRALYGHSFFVDMDGEPMDPPPARLYMGTTRSAAQRFTREGISPGDRYYVHLSLTARGGRVAQSPTRHPLRSGDPRGQGPRGGLSLFSPRHGRADRRNPSQLHRPHPR